MQVMSQFLYKITFIHKLVLLINNIELTENRYWISRYPKLTRSGSGLKQYYLGMESSGHNGTCKGNKQVQLIEDWNKLFDQHCNL